MRLTNSNCIRGETASNGCKLSPSKGTMMAHWFPASTQLKILTDSLGGSGLWDISAHWFGAFQGCRWVAVLSLHPLLCHCNCASSSFITLLPPAIVSINSLLFPLCCNLCSSDSSSHSCLLQCVCVCVRVRARARACARVCVCVSFKTCM